MATRHLSFSRLQLGGIVIVLALGGAPDTADAQVGKPTKKKASAPISTSQVDVAIPWMRFGKVTQVNGLAARAQSTSASNSTIDFTFGSDLQGDVPRGLPVWVNTSAAKVRFTRFPLTMPGPQKTEVGQGSVGKGAFIVKTSDVTVAPGGMINGTTTVKSEDLIEGFTGVVWVELLDHDRIPVFHKRALCRGVNLNQSPTERWTVSAPPDSAAKAHHVRIYHGRMGCDRDRWDEAPDKLKKAGEAAGAWAEAYATYQSGGAAGAASGSSTSSPTTPR